MKPLDMPALTAEQIDALASCTGPPILCGCAREPRWCCWPPSSSWGYGRSPPLCGSVKARFAAGSNAMRPRDRGTAGFVGGRSAGQGDPSLPGAVLQLVRRRPRSLDLPYSTWTLQRLADELAERTGIRVQKETVRVHLLAAEIVFSRPQHTISSPDPEYAVKKRRLKTPATI